MSERYDREEEPRRRSRERRAPDSHTGDEGYRDREIRSASRSGGSSGMMDKVTETANRVRNRGGRGGSSSGEQAQGLYGSQVDSSNLMGLAVGIALVVIVAAIGHVSGAHVNPAVTLALAVTKKFSWQYVPIYLVAQLVGAILGAIAVWITYGGAAQEAASLAATFPTEGVGDLQALVVEILVTFILVFVVISVATDERAPAGVAPLAVGFALACGVLIAGPITGGSLNPARTLGPMIVAGQFTTFWVYLVGPIVGAVLAALVYERFASQSDATE